MAIDSNSFKQLSKNLGIFFHSTNIGVINVSSGLYLIDSGASDEDGKNLLETLKSLFPHKKLLGIFNTHSHADHCGGNSFLVENTKCKVWAPQLESLVMQFPYLMAAMYWGGNPYENLKSQNFVNTKINKVDHILNSAEIDLGEVSVKSIPLPGHYFDQTGFLLCDKVENKKIFFLGDGFFGIPLLKKFWIPFMYEPEEFRNSVEKIEEIAADYYIPSHGDVCLPQNLSAVAELNIIVTLEFERLIKKLLLKKTMNQEELLKAVCDFSEIKLGEGNYILIGTTLRSYLSSMERRNLVAHKIVDNRLLWFAV